MINNTTEVYITGKTAGQIYDWIVNVNEERYLLWHPDHQKYEVKNQSETYLGRIVYYEQKTEGAGANLEWKVVKDVKGSFLLYRARFIYPIYLSITLENTKDGAHVIHDLRLGYQDGFLSGILDQFVKRFIFTEQDQKINDRHVTEEFKNLEWLIK